MKITFKGVIHIIIYIILIVLLVIQFRKPATVIDNSHIYQNRIDSIMNTIGDTQHVIDSLENVIVVNDLQIDILVKSIERLIRERNENKFTQSERDKEIASMSNDSLVLFVREQLKLWSAE